MKIPRCASSHPEQCIPEVSSLYWQWFQRYARHKLVFFVRTDGRTYGRTDGHRQLYMPPHLKWWGHKNRIVNKSCLLQVMLSVG